MKDRFNRVGVSAGTAKRLQVLRTPPASETREMNRMYGNVARSIATVRSNLAGVAANPGAVNEQLGFRVAATGPIFREHRNEGLRERALGEQAPQQVGNPESDEKSVS